MGILDLPRRMLGKTLSRGSLFSMLGSYATGKFLAYSRQKWEKAREQSERILLEQISPYEVSKGAGKLLKGWLLFNEQGLSVSQAEKQLQKLLQEMDCLDTLPEEQARSRFLVSKTLFYLEGFKLSHCRYEPYQKTALTLLQKNPAHKNLTRGEVFRGAVFLPEDLIASTHRMLLMLDNDDQLAEYIRYVLDQPSLRDDADYMAQLIALTLQADDKTLEHTINRWFASYCDYKLDQADQREAFINTSITTATGGLPTTLGMDLLSRAGKVLFKKR